MLAVLILAAGAGLAPMPVRAVSWKAPPAPGYVGAHAANTRLAARAEIALGGEVGPESIALDADGRLYVAVAAGRILRMDPDGGRREVFATSGGRPLGLAFDRRGQLIVADALKGLLSVAPDGRVSLLTNTVGGSPIRFANAVAIAGSGKIYFTDSSARFAPADHGGTMEAALLDITEHASTGRVLEYDPVTEATRIVAGRLCFPNGVALAADERSLFVAETGNYRVLRIPVDGEGLDIAGDSSQVTVVLGNLPGFPDNLTRGRDGRIWLGLAGQRNGLDALSDWPLVRELVLRIPRALWPVPKAYGHLVAFTEDGTVVDDLQDPMGNSPATTGATEGNGRLYIQNVDGRTLGWIAR